MNTLFKNDTSSKTRKYVVAFSIFFLAIVLAVLFSRRIIWPFFEGQIKAYYAEGCYEKFKLVAPTDFDIYFIRVKKSNLSYSVLDDFIRNKHYICTANRNSKINSICTSDPDHLVDISKMPPGTEFTVTPTTITTSNSGIGESLKGKDTRTFIKLRTAENEYWISQPDLVEILNSNSNESDYPIEEIVNIQNSCVNYEKPLENGIVY